MTNLKTEKIIDRVVVQRNNQGRYGFWDKKTRGWLTVASINSFRSRYNASVHLAKHRNGLRHWLAR